MTEGEADAELRCEDAYRDYVKFVNRILKLPAAGGIMIVIDGGFIKDPHVIKTLKKSPMFMHREKLKEQLFEQTHFFIQAVFPRKLFIAYCKKRRHCKAHAMAKALRCISAIKNTEQRAELASGILNILEGFLPVMVSKN